MRQKKKMGKEKSDGSNGKDKRDNQGVIETRALA